MEDQRRPRKSRAEGFAGSGWSCSCCSCCATAGGKSGSKPWASIVRRAAALRSKGSCWVIVLLVQAKGKAITSRGMSGRNGSRAGFDLWGNRAMLAAAFVLHPLHDKFGNQAIHGSTQAEHLFHEPRA